MRADRTPWLIVLIAVLGTLACLGVLLFLAGVSRPRQAPTGLVTAALTVIPAPTQTPIPPTPAPPTPTPQRDVPPGPAAGVLSVGAYVQISGTGGDGLNLRAGPGLGFDALYLGLESEVFEVIDGPREADGYTWWHLAAPNDATLNGWAVANYLAVVDGP